MDIVKIAAIADNKLNNKTINKTKTMEDLKIYVGTYRKYNDGSIAGAWIDVTDLSEEEFYQKCKELHSDEEDPEYMFQDWEIDNFLKEYVSEGGIDSEFWEVKDKLNDLNDDEIEAIDAFCSLGFDLDLDDFRNKYIGHFQGYDINREFGEYWADQTGELLQIPDHLRYYFDYEAYGRDLLINDFSEYNGFVFLNY